MCVGYASQIGEDMRKFCLDMFNMFDDDGSGEIDNQELGEQFGVQLHMSLLIDRPSCGKPSPRNRALTLKTFHTREEILR